MVGILRRSRHIINVGKLLPWPASTYNNRVHLEITHHKIEALWSKDEI
jgi:hypothetical protein